MLVLFTRLKILNRRKKKTNGNYLARQVWLFCLPPKYGADFPVRHWFFLLLKLSRNYCHIIFTYTQKFSIVRKEEPCYFVVATYFTSRKVLSFDLDFSVRQMDICPACNHAACWHCFCVVLWYCVVCPYSLPVLSPWPWGVHVYRLNISLLLNHTM